VSLRADDDAQSAPDLSGGAWGHALVTALTASPPTPPTLPTPRQKTPPCNR